MKTIKEYRIKKDLVTTQTLYIVKNAIIVNLIELAHDLLIIVICDPIETDTELRTFKVCSTYETIYNDNIKYVGNFGIQHVIEIL